MNTNLRNALDALLASARTALADLEEATTTAINAVVPYVVHGLRAGIIVPEDKKVRTFFHVETADGRVPLGVVLGTYNADTGEATGSHTTALAAAHAARAIVHAGVRGAASVTAGTASAVLDTAGIPTGTATLRRTEVTDALKAFSRGDDTSVTTLRGAMADATSDDRDARPGGNTKRTPWERFARDASALRERYDTLMADDITANDTAHIDTAYGHVDYIRVGLADTLMDDTMAPTG